MRKQILKELTFDQPVKTNEIYENKQKEEPILSSNTTGISAEHYNKFYGSGNKIHRSCKKIAKSKYKRGEAIFGSGINIL
jgi:hypothetical protein